MDKTGRRRGKRWLAIAIKLLVVALVAWFIRRAIVEAWGQLHEQRWQLDFWWLAASGGLYLLGTLCCAIFWHRTLRALGQPVSLAQAVRAYYVGQLGKYVPGKAMVVILRAGMVRGQGGDAAPAAVSVFFETLTMMAAGAFLSAAVLAVWFHEQTVWFWAAVAAMCISGVPVLPPVFKRLVRLVGVGKWDIASDEQLSAFGYRLAAMGWALTALGWVFLGASLWAVLRAMGAADCDLLGRLHLYTASVALATVVGFVSFVPSGAGVREAALTETLKLTTPQLGGGMALIAAILLRLACLVAELVISGILYVGIRGQGPQDRERGSASEANKPMNPES
jgi:glycosyltransferase 2 family protein